MNILFLSTENPFPPDHGHHIRTYHILKNLAAQHRVFFLAFANTEEEAVRKKALEEFCVSADIIVLPRPRWRKYAELLRNLFAGQPYIVQRYVSKRARRRIHQIIEHERIEVMHFDLPHLAAYLAEAGALPKVLTNHNVESLRVARWAHVEKNLLLKAYLRLQALKLARFESRLCPKFERCIAVSEFDRQVLTGMCRCDNFAMIPNGVDCDYFRMAPAGTACEGLAWVGSMSGAYNRDAVDYFLSRIAPYLYARLPQLKMTFVGASPTALLRKKAQEHAQLTYTGYVDDVRPYVDQAAVFIAPLRSGSGTKIKILNAMSQGKPVVTTSVGAEGIAAKPEKEIIIADNEIEFAQKIMRLFNNPQEAEEIGRRGRCVVERLYDWKVVTANMSAIYEQAVKQKTKWTYALQETRGHTMPDQIIPFHRPLIEESDVEAVVACMRSGWLTTGPRVKEFEEKFAAYAGAPHAIAVNSCTAAMHLALAALGLKPGDEVITSPITFVATCEAIQYVGARPVFVDVDPRTLNLNPDHLGAALTQRTHAIMPVHIAGHPANMPRILAFAKQHHLKVVEDAAHATEAAILPPPQTNGHAFGSGKIGTISEATCFSFYATKNLTTAEGGMITCSDPELAQHIRRLALHGLSNDAWKRYTVSGSWYYQVMEQGYKYNLTDMAASLGLTQLAKIEAMWQRRAEIAQRYHRAFVEMPELEIPAVQENVRHAWHLYVLRLQLDRLSINRNQFFDELRQQGIHCSVHFIPLHLMPYYRQKYQYREGDFPEAERQFRRIISLPLYPALTDDQIDRVVAAVKRIVLQNSRSGKVYAAAPARAEA